MGADALRVLGFRAHHAQRSARKLRRLDEASVHEMAGMRHDQERYVLRTRELVREVEEALQEELAERDASQDAAWDIAALRRAAVESSANDPGGL
jgi:hypothetical protein